MSKSKELLKECEPFNEFDESIVERFIAASCERQFSAGDILYAELSEGNEIYFIVDGQVRISVEMASAYHGINDLEGGPGELVGTSRFIVGGPRPATVTAVSDVTALVWDIETWKTIADEHPEVGYRLAIYAGKVLFTRVHLLNKQIINDIAWGLE